jgi:hypothetical protein
MFKRLVPLLLKYLEGRTVRPGSLIHIIITVAEMVKGGILSQEELVHVGNTVAEMVKGECCKSGKVGRCWYHCGGNG